MNHDACISSNRRRAWSTRGQANGEEACVAGAMQGVKNKDQKELHAEAETRKVHTNKERDFIRRKAVTQSSHGGSCWVRNKHGGSCWVRNKHMILLGS
jgi:hypothetical protein